MPPVTGLDVRPPPVTSPLLESMGIRDRWMLERIQYSAPLLLALGLEPIKRARGDADRAQQARAARVGRDLGIVDKADHGHSIRGDIEVDHRAMDPKSPNVRIRRARRADPLHTLHKHHSISGRHFDAVEALRSDIENAMPSLSGASQSEIHAAPWDRIAVTDRQIEACASVRAALADVPRRDRLVLAWMIGGGTISGFVLFAHVHRQAAVLGLKNALDVVADFYLGALAT